MTTNNFPGMTADWLIDRYVKLRDKKRGIEAAHKLELAKYNDMLTRIEEDLLNVMKTSGLTNMKCQHGTAFQSTQWSTKVLDWARTLGYIREHDAWDLLEARVNKTAAIAVMEETKEPVPGVDVSSRVVVNVRRPNEQP